MGCFAPSSEIQNVRRTHFSTEEIVRKNTFKKISRIGTGASSEVFLVKSETNNKYYALKIVEKAKGVNQQEDNYFRREAKILSKINNDHIIKCFATFHEKNEVCFLLEFASGGDLFHHICLERGFNESKAKFYAAEIILALEELHRNKIIYRDLKPENVLISRTGHIKLADFGLSKQLEKANQTAKTFCGTLTHIAPEIYLGKEYSKNVDWYSLGILIYQMLCGCLPFCDSNHNSLMKKILSTNPILPSHLSPTAVDLIEKLLEKDPNKRLCSSGLDAKEIKEHTFFKDIDFEKIINLKPPFIPSEKCEEAILNFPIGIRKNSSAGASIFSRTIENNELTLS